MTDRLPRTELGVADRVDLRCSVLNLAQGADPIGTAGTYSTYLLIDLPLPWPPDISDHPLLAQLPGALVPAAGKTRVQATVPAEPEDPTHRIVAYHRIAGPFRSYARAEATVPTGAGARAIADGCRDLLTDLLADLLVDPQPGSTIVPDGERSASADVLVCTHGRRDRCCGSMGTNVFTESAARGVPGARLARTSHLGGHRFAATALFLPEGHLWAWLDSDLIAAIAHRSAPVATVLPHYRGSSAVGSAAVQVCERAAFAAEGWGWLDAHREGRVVDEADGVTTVRITCTRPDGSRGAYEGTVREVGRLPQPVCGVGEVADGKSDPVWELTDFGAVDPAASAP